jgi:protease-4
MALDSDALIDRRRLKRRLGMWRFTAFVAVVALVAVAVGRTSQIPGSRHIAVLWVEDLILSDPYREAAVRALIEDDSVAALLVHIDSPGGTTFASESLYRALRQVAESKPVVATWPLSPPTTSSRARAPSPARSASSSRRPTSSA